MHNISSTFFTSLFNATFNATDEGNYTCYIFANDTLGNSASSNQTNVSVFYDYTWSLSSGLNNSSGTFSTNISIGNVTINNTGDFAQNFTLTAGAYNDRVWFNNSSAPSSFNVPAGASVEIPVTVSTRPAGQTEGSDTITITGTGSGRLAFGGTATYTITSNLVHAYYGKKGAIDVVIQDLAEMEMVDDPYQRAKIVRADAIYGIKTFADGRPQFLDVQLQS